MNEGHNKFTESEYIVGGLVTLAIDGVCILIDLTGVGLFLAPIAQGAATFGIEWVVERKGGSMGPFDLKRFLKYLSNAAPLFPTVTAIFFFSAYMHNHPEKFAAVEKMAGFTGGKPPAITSTANIAKTAQAMGVPKPIE